MHLAQLVISILAIVVIDRTAVYDPRTLSISVLAVFEG
jgi:hypothetical protein